MKAKASIQYTIRQVPSAVDEALRNKAEREGRSLNETTLEVIKNGLLLSDEPVRHHDLDFMIGSWVDDPAFDAAIEAQDQVDEALWK